MTPEYTIAVGNDVDVPVKFTLKEKKVNKTFAFTLLAQRLEQEAIAKTMAENEYKFKEGLIAMDCLTGWEGQRLVIDADGKPAEFSATALDAMLSVPAVAQIVYQSYLKEIGAKEKN